MCRQSVYHSLNSRYEEIVGDVVQVTSVLEPLPSSTAGTGGGGRWWGGGGWGRWGVVGWGGVGEVGGRWRVWWGWGRLGEVEGVVW